MGKDNTILALLLIILLLAAVNIGLTDAILNKIIPAPQQQTSCDHSVINIDDAYYYIHKNKSTDDFYIGQIRYNATDPFDTLFIKIVAIKQDHCQYVFIDDETKKTMKWRYTRRISVVTDVYDEVYNERH